ncbi:transposable element Tcb2 transposase [Trichonephila clavipes]|uniref:Transposable element Tcb2 transposase n=1 Tax=Trichonephila clavipes TaxID=2585209 RepID=A0A8X6SAM6_TRICX|nr:transposable element Tcb2 transposase [Trichonephila clavipes]
MFDSSKPDDDVVNFVSKLKSHMQSLHPKPPKHHGKRPVFIHPGLLEATHVFLRRDMLRRPLQQPYDGPFKVLQRKDKVFSLTSMNETPATVEPNATASTPATVESDPTASTPTQPSTRSGRKVHLPTSVVARVWNRFQEIGHVRRRPGAGRPRATTSTDDRYIQLTARRNRTENATQLQRQLLLATGRRVSNQTVRNRLHEGGLCARRPMVCIPLTPHHRAARRRWADEHRDWEQHDWSQVLFTDESRFSLECDTRRVLVWRDRGTRNNPAFVRERSQYRRAGWMVWGGICIGGRTDLHIIRNGTLTGRRYADEILRPRVIPYAGAIGDSFVFQDDYARPHRPRLVENMLEAETIQRMGWPACSPDLIPIEHVWDILGRRIAARRRPPATVRDLEIALLEEWNSILQSLIDNLIASMANRCAAVLAVRGDHTP